jgi:dipeptidyl aminopeptidase/acylaminoacyl peptidase
MVTRERRALIYLALSLIILVGGSREAFAQTSQDACGEAAEQETGTATAKRPLTTRDLVRLRDIGSVYPQPEMPMFSLSPNGESIAFQVRRADPEHNRYCLGIFVASLRSAGHAREIDRGGDLLLDRSDQLGRANLEVGTPRTITLKWGPDSSWVTFLKRVNSITQVWRAKADGSESRPLTRSIVDVDDFAISKDGRTLIYATRAGVVRAQAKIEAEGKAGYHYDERFFPSASPMPFAPSGIATEYSALDILTDQTAPASTLQIAELTEKPPRMDAARPGSKSGRLFWRLDPSSGFPTSSRPALEDAAGSIIECDAAVCLGEQSVMWATPDLHRIYFLRREGWGGSMTGVYVWEPWSGRTRRVFQTSDLLFDCVAVGEDTICVTEGATQPRRIVRFADEFARTTILYDPNPEFASLATGYVERLAWKNEYGLEVFGDLVYPTNYSQGMRYPLVVAQYTSRGFLRGGTGDELPIQALANRGFAVLSVQRPSPLPLAKGAKDAYEVDRMILQDFRDRRSVLSSIEIAVEMLVQRGIVDRARVGISGLSDGSSTVQFAALNSNAFAAASVSGCCWEPNQEAYLGQSIGRHFERSGWPNLSDSKNRMWESISLSIQPDRVRFPILMQMADEEYLMALQSFTALREAGKPVDLFVFPLEHHFKWQASHRQAVYDRNIAWFEFWLMDKTPSFGSFVAEAKRWGTMKMAERRLPKRPDPPQ